MVLRLLIGSSSPTAVACCASAISEDAMGSSVNVMCLNVSARMSALRLLPVSVASCSLAACSAAA